MSDALEKLAQDAIHQSKAGKTVPLQRLKDEWLADFNAGSIACSQSESDQMGVELDALRTIAAQLAEALETPGYVWKTPSGDYLWHERFCNSRAGDDCQRRCTSQRAALAAWKEWNRD